MSELNLNKTEIAILTGAAGQDGRITWPERLKAVTRQRLLGRLLRDGLVAGEPGGEDHLLTRAGYRSVGLEPPRLARAGTKQALVLELLGRTEGASLPELTEATGWLPHTTRAVLSRLRSSGRPLARSARSDGATAYRFEAAAG